jgi:hypothetical protein
MTRRYDEPENISKREFAAIRDSGDVARICKGLVDAAFHVPDWEWLQEECLQVSYGDDPWLRKVACICLGHVARIHGKLDNVRVMARLTELLTDPDPMVRGNAEDTIEGIAEVWKPTQTPPCRR